MKILEGLYHALKSRAAETIVETVSIGLGYTAVVTAGGGIGLACTMLESVKTCHVAGDLPDFENRPADTLLELLLSDAPFHRTLSLALANALNHAEARELPEDRHNTILFDRLGIGPGSKVAMVGHFGPLLKKLAGLKAEVEMVDKGRGEGSETALLRKLGSWAEALIMTSTTLINGTAEEILSAAGPQVRVAMIGPSTPLIAGPFSGLRIHLLGGTVPVEQARTLAAIRHGRGTPALQRFARKTYLELMAPA